jgi:hypothetical protein
MSFGSDLRGLVIGCAAAAAIAVGACSEGSTEPDPAVETARILTATVLASVNPEVPASMGQTLSGGISVKVTYEETLADTTELKFYICLSETDSPMLNASCVSASRPAGSWQSPNIMTTLSSPGRTFRFLHVFLMRGADPIPGMGQLPTQYLDKRTEAILILT